jgi:hypothetical protein
MENASCASIILSVFGAFIGFAGTIFGAFVAYFLASRQAEKSELSGAKSELISALVLLNKRRFAKLDG